LKNLKPKPKIEGNKRETKCVDKWNNIGMSRKNGMLELGHKQTKFDDSYNYNDG
jgi:hypothetical protein